ncbi:SRPBCC family protein [Flavobacterium sp. ST-75]|uniref:SRPBCC family protein n=1 Tax=Flavobacterium rhizophilum TaxID=3163296 RepID=A0ABW8YE14_9FLAO
MQTDFKITHQTVVNAHVSDVWKALTDPKMVRQYFFGSNLETTWKVGKPIRFYGEYKGTRYEDKGIVLEYNENDKLSYSYHSSWTTLPDEPQYYLEVSYQVKKIPGGTELTISQTNYDEEKAQHSLQNWEVVTNRLKELIED